MSRAYNFSAGPSTLPLPVIEEAAAELVEYRGSGMSIMEASHRGKEYDEIHLAAISLVKELLGLPENYQVLFLGGGATMQFSMIPLNLLREGKSCDFTVTGAWAKKAYADAAKVGSVNVLFDGKDDGYSSLPDPGSLEVTPGAAYLHMTSNETIGGLEWQSWPETGDVPIVCDMSSDIMSRRIPVEKFGMIYAGAQKNLGPAGLAVVIIRDDILDQCSDDLTAYLSYKLHADKGSRYNTPPTYPIYIMRKVLDWVKEQGGLEGAEKMATERSGLIYGAMDASGGFYNCPVPSDCRSVMNIVWRLPSEELEAKFVAEAAAKGLIGLKGHRSVGGIRASVYNAMPVAGAEALAGFMAEFAAANG